MKMLLKQIHTLTLERIRTDAKPIILISVRSYRRSPV